MTTKMWLIVAGVVITTGGGGFYGGIKYQQTKPPTFTRLFDGASGAAGRNIQRFRDGNITQGATMGGGFRPVSGEIIRVDNGSMTVKLHDESSKIVILPVNVEVSKSETGALTDLTEGQQVMVVGTENEDGSVTAQSVQLNPQFRGADSVSPTPNPSAS